MSVEVRPGESGAGAPDGTSGAGEPDGTVPSTGPPRPSTAAGHKPVLAAGRSGIPRRALVVLVAAAVVFALTATLSARFLTSTSAPPHRTAPLHASRSPAGQAPPAGAHQLGGSLSHFLGLTSLHEQRAPGFSLTDAATGAPVSLASLRGHVVVLTFANGACDDLCPVLLSELRQARSLLGQTPVPVTFLTVNTDPLVLLKTSGPYPPAILSEPAATGLTGWRFLNGSIPHLNSVWTAYGIAVTVDRASGTVAHNNLLYFIDPDGKLAWGASPFADESRARTFSLPASQADRFAQGIAHYARLLATNAP
ncbi:MAG: SCO family protein [Acidimicrobiales bacterium]